MAALSQRARHFVGQMEADLVEARNLAERAARALDVLRTQADILQATWERRLALFVGVIGMALAAGQVLDRESVKVLYQNSWVGDVWVRLGGLPLGQGKDDLVLSLIRACGVLLVALIAWLLFWLISRRVAPEWGAHRRG